jgi:hypothetical protein
MHRDSLGAFVFDGRDDNRKARRLAIWCRRSMYRCHRCGKRRSLSLTRVLMRRIGLHFDPMMRLVAFCTPFGHAPTTLSPHNGWLVGVPRGAIGGHWKKAEMISFYAYRVVVF